MTTLLQQPLAIPTALRTILWSLSLVVAVIWPLRHVAAIVKDRKGHNGIGNFSARTELLQCAWRVPALLFPIFVMPSLPLFLSIFLDLLGRIGRVLAMRASRGASSHH